MIDQSKFQEYLEKEGVEFITGVPDTLLNEFCLLLQNNWPPKRHVIAANEGNAIALASGYHLNSGSVPLVYMQNSGLGNALNPMLSLTNKEVYSIPICLLIGWRGNPNSNDHLHHKKQGELTPELLDSLDIPYKILEDNEETFETLSWAITTAKEISSPVALLAQEGVLEKGDKKDLSQMESKYEMTREGTIELLLDELSEDTIYIATTGRATRELYYLRESRNESHDKDFLNVGAMGHVSSIATGIAISNPDRLVVCIDGDASTIMHLGALTTSGNLDLPNFLHVVLNNGAHESVGGQPSVGFQVNLTGIAKNSGYSTINGSVATEDELKVAVEKLVEENNPGFIDVHIRKGMRSILPSLNITPTVLKQELMKQLKDNNN